MVPKRIRTVEGSCWPCKDRRVICDLQHPECSRCASSGRVCSYSKVRLKWCNGIAARGRFAGRNSPVSASATSSTSTATGAGIYSGAGEGSSLPQRNPDDDDCSTVVSLSPPGLGFSLLSAAGLEPTLVMTADHLMLYFQYEVVDRFNVARDRLQVDVGSACKDPVLLQSVTAVANAHHFLYARRSPRDETILEKKMARLSAIRMFRERLQMPCFRQQQQQAVAEVDSQLDTTAVKDLFVTNVLLCILDGIIEPEDEGAATYLHFRGGRAILTQWGFLDQLFRVKKGLCALMLSIFVTIDLTQALLSGEAPYFSPPTWTDFAESDSWWGILSPGDPFLEIMGIFSHLAHLGNQIRTTGVPPPPSELLSILNALGQEGSHAAKESGFVTSPPGSPTQPTSPSDMDDCGPLDYDQSWEIFCSAYRQAALIYVYRVLCNLPVTHPLVQQTTEVGLQAICETRLAGKLSHCLIFPALVIGSQCLAPEQRGSLRKSLLTTATFLYFGSIPVMDQFLQDLWARSDPDVSWWDCFASISRKTFLF